MDFQKKDNTILFISLIFVIVIFCIYIARHFYRKNNNVKKVDLSTPLNLYHKEIRQSQNNVRNDFYRYLADNVSIESIQLYVKLNSEQPKEIPVCFNLVN